MKYYCIQYESCGFFFYDSDIQPEDFLTCPACGHMLLAYELGTTPFFLSRDTQKPSSFLEGSSRSQILGVEDNELYTD